MQLRLEDIELPARLHTVRPMTDEELLLFSSVDRGVWFKPEVLEGPRAAYGDGSVGDLVLELARTKG